MGSRKENLKWMQHLIQSNPGFKADFYISKAMSELGLKRQTIVDYLKTLAESGKIKLQNDRFYPYGQKIKRLDEDEERLLNWLQTISKDVKPETAKENQEDWYLVIYDIKDDINPTEKRRIYRNLLKACQRITKEGGIFEHIQMSVWKVKGKEHANILASAIPENHARIHIFKITEE